jgi:hypothetical protein
LFCRWTGGTAWGKGVILMDRVESDFEKGGQTVEGEKRN